VELTLAATVPGIELTLGGGSGPAPFTQTLIEGSEQTVSAPATADVGGVRYAFRSWSDGGARTHTVTADAAATITARYAAVSADLALKSWAVKGRSTLLTFVLRVRNNGPAKATNATLTDKLPARVWFGWIEGAKGCTFNTRTDILRCPLGTLASGKVKLLRVHTWLNGSPASVVNDARVASAAPDLAAANSRSRLKVGLR
jgi:hypothetical protein